jgi:hypothetical protein
MPWLTLTGAPRPQSVAVDDVTGHRFTLGRPVEVDDPESIVARFASLPAYTFTVTDAPAVQENPVVTDPAAVQEADSPAPDPAPAP